MKQKRQVRSDIKFNRRQAIRLLSMGFSQKDVAELLNVHKTSIGKFVRANDIKTVDNTKSIGLHLQERLTPDQLTWLYSKVSPSTTIMDYLEGVIKAEFSAPSSKDK